MELGLKNKVALVIGSSQGLGKAIAEQFVREGANVMITGRHGAKLEAVHQELQALNAGNTAYYPADITNPQAIKELVQQTKAAFGKIDILINNAGGPPTGSFESISDEDWESAFQLNLLSYVRMIRAVLPDLKTSGGRIINIVSSSIKQPIPNLILSNTFRLGIVGMAKTLAEELAPYNILINNVAPGKIATDRVTHLDQTVANRQNKSLEEVEAASKNNIPLQRYGDPQEFANMVVFLASEASSYTTGASVFIDGGNTRAI